MGKENKCYLLLRSNPCCQDGDEYIGIFEKLELIRQYAESLVELRELQEKGYYLNYDLFIYSFEKNQNDEGTLIKIGDIETKFDVK